MSLPSDRKFSGFNFIYLKIKNVLYVLSWQKAYLSFAIYTSVKEEEDKEIIKGLFDASSRIH